MYENTTKVNGNHLNLPLPDFFLARPTSSHKPMMYIAYIIPSISAKCIDFSLFSPNLHFCISLF